MSLCAAHEAERGFVHVDDRTLGTFLEAERCALIVIGRDCTWCQDYLAGVRVAHTLGELHQLPVGVLVLDQPGAENFLRYNDWLSDAEGLPYTALFHEGRRVVGFVAFNVFALIDRLELLAFVPQPVPQPRRTPARLAA